MSFGSSLYLKACVLSVHVSPWESNERGRSPYNQIGTGRKRLRDLMRKHGVLICLSGHYHRGLWHQQEEKTHYLVLGGTARVNAGGFGWCLFEVYPDRIVMHFKPLFFGYEKPNPKRIHGTQGWLNYADLKKRYPYLQMGPLSLKRLHPAKPK